jgi:hypothetical protein
MNSDHYDQMQQMDPELRKRFDEMFESKEVETKELLKQGVDKITYFERRKDNLKPQSK